MKRSKRRMPIPQFEFPYSAESFRLIQDTAIDGERVSREREEAEKTKALADAAQAPLFASTHPNRLDKQ